MQIPVMDQILVGLHDKSIQGEVLAKDSHLKNIWFSAWRYDYIHTLKRVSVQEPL